MRPDYDLIHSLEYRLGLRDDPLMVDREPWVPKPETRARIYQAFARCTDNESVVPSRFT